MSDDIRKLQAQIGILTEKASDLEVICAYIIENFSLEDTSDQSRQIAATELRRLAQTHQGKGLSAPDDSAFHKVAKHILAGVVNRGFGAFGAGR